MDKTELVRIVERLMNAQFSTDEEGSELAELLKRNVPHPAVTNLIFWNDEELTAEEVVEKALIYKPIPLPEKFD